MFSDPALCAMTKPANNSAGVANLGDWLMMTFVSILF